ncbi:MAG: putative zinc-binding protein [Pseudomonadota bacterium]
MASNKHDLPLVYSCSGCSSAAQMANHVALALDRRGVAQMSCIAGVGGDVPSLLKTARSGRTIIAIDGCQLACVRQCLARHDIEPQRHVLLNRCGVQKRYHADFEPDLAAAITNALAADIANTARLGACTEMPSAPSPSGAPDSFPIAQPRC